MQGTGLRKSQRRCLGMINRIKTILVFLVISFMCIEVSYAQPKIPKDEIPLNVDSEIKARIEELYSKDADKRATAAYYLGGSGPQRDAAVSAARFLIELLDDDNNATVLKWENVVMGGVSLPFSTNPVKRSTTPGIEAGKALGLLSRYNNAIVKYLVTVLKDKNWVVRKNAIWGLAISAKDNDPTAMEALIAILNDENGSVRESAIAVLQTTSGQDFGQDQTKWQGWWEENNGNF